MMRKYICLAIFIVVLVLVFCNSCTSTAMSMGSNSSSSIIGDDGHLEFLMDSHSTRFLQTAGHPVQGSLDASKAVANCGRGNPYSCLPRPGKPRRGEHCGGGAIYNRGC
ncbi:hypothetical protein V6N13_127939 [Hibiscus sabdariffa]|uniref:Rapid ALkalinization Factor n=2 Tax=Hibiscus sabdariffa TaxID=183260 RepID=A0ABR2AEA8_9ROSI